MSNVMGKNKVYVFAALRGMSLCIEEGEEGEETGRSVGNREEMLWGVWKDGVDVKPGKGEEKKE